MHQCWHLSPTGLSLSSLLKKAGFRAFTGSWRNSSGRTHTRTHTYKGYEGGYSIILVMFNLFLVPSLKYRNLCCPFLLSHPLALWKERDSQCDKNQSASYPVLRSQHQPAALWGLCSLIHAHIRILCNSSPLSRLKSIWCISLAIVPIFTNEDILIVACTTRVLTY